MKHYLIFAGTTEGRQLVEFFIKQSDISLTVCTATEYGKILLPSHPNLTVLSKRLDENEMYELMMKGNFDVVFDTTHPYAVIVSQNIKAAADKANLTYKRILRPAEEMSKPCENQVFVSTMEEAVAYLENTTGNILCTTGSKELHKLCALTDFQNRVYARIISNPDMVRESFNLGFQGKHLICMQGPFSEELNIALIHQFDIAFMITKNSGKQGGFPEKLTAAQKTNTTLIQITRPAETLSPEQTLTLEEVQSLYI